MGSYPDDRGLIVPLHNQNLATTVFKYQSFFTKMFIY